MKKKPVSESIKETLLDNQAYGMSLAVHMRAFGEILAPAFAEDKLSKVRLVLALNHISQKDIDKGEGVLDTLREACKTPADHAAWYFFKGVAREMAGDAEGMKQYYTHSFAYGHTFYLPYLKMAKIYHQEGDFAKAREGYQATLSCFYHDISTYDEQTRQIIASVYSNLASALTMMHLYAEAEQALKKSAEMIPILYGRDVACAILSAAMGDADRVAFYIERMRNHPNPTVRMNVAPTQAETQKILKGKHPQFSVQPLDEQTVAGFWTWLVKEKEGLVQVKNSVALMRINGALTQVFPYMYKQMVQSFAICDNDNLSLVLRDRFAVALAHGYEILQASVPQNLPFHIDIQVIH